VITTLTPDELELLHDEIDGLNSPERSALARALLERSGEARRQHAQLETINAAIARIERAMPPDTLRPAILRAVAPNSAAARPRRRDAVFSYFRSSVRTLRQAESQLFPGMTSNTQTATARAQVRSSRESKMSKSDLSSWFSARTIVVAGATAALVGGVAYYGASSGVRDALDEAQVAGTIVPAERYRGESLSAEDVTLGDQDIQGLLQTDAFDSLIRDPDFVSLLADADFRALAAEGSLARVMADASFKSLSADVAFKSLSSDARWQSLASDAKLAKLSEEARAAAVRADDRYQALAGDARYSKLLADGRAVKLASNATFAKLAADARFQAVMADGRAARLMADGRLAAFMSDGRAQRAMADARRADALQQAIAADARVH
jgi:hypothetical protein